MRRRRVLLLLPLVGAVAFVAVCAVQLFLTSRRDYLPPDPGFTIDFVAQPAGVEGAARGVAIELAVLGDSTVAGLGADNERDTLAGFIARQVATETGRPVHVTGLGISGARLTTVRDVQVPLLADLHPRPDVVVLEVGSNDVTHATPLWKIDDQTRSLLRAVGTAVGEDTPIVLGSAGKLNSPNFAQPLRSVMMQSATLVRSRQARVANDLGVGFVDIAKDVSPRYDSTPGSISRDRFHPSPIGYEIWAQPISDLVVEAVRGPASPSS